MTSSDFSGKHLPDPMVCVCVCVFLVTVVHTLIPIENQVEVTLIANIMFSISKGEITHYVILRDGQERYRGDEHSFTDVGGIRPFMEYRYQLRACNRAGCADSMQVHFLINRHF